MAAANEGTADAEVEDVVEGAGGTATAKAGNGPGADEAIEGGPSRTEAGATTTESNGVDEAEAGYAMRAVGAANDETARAEGEDETWAAGAANEGTVGAAEADETRAAGAATEGTAGAEV